MSYTKGPWKVFNDTFNKISITGEDGNDGILRVVAQLKGAPKETIQANANLIAAAPEMLEALITVSQFYQDYFEIMPVAFETVAYLVDDVITKAKGR